ncbi:hypothetical protein [Allorhizobium undicola]|uniref:hypothetical protein n=1 Tax=Allorhizobium undicola TaxID=78527 RepID=UPI0012B5A175|nr:hypothetical protein [Allorhizobium undicola]
MSSTELTAGRMQIPKKIHCAARREPAETAVPHNHHGPSAKSQDRAKRHIAAKTPRKSGAFAGKQHEREKPARDALSGFSFLRKNEDKILKLMEKFPKS